MFSVSASDVISDQISVVSDLRIPTNLSRSVLEVEAFEADINDLELIR